MVEPKRADSALTDALTEFAQAAGLQGGVAPASASVVFQVVEDANRKFQSSSPKSIKFSQKLLPCLESLNRFSSVIDTFIQSNPTISGLVWGSLKFLLQVRSLRTVQVPVTYTDVEAAPREHCNLPPTSNGWVKCLKNLANFSLLFPNMKRSSRPPIRSELRCCICTQMLSTSSLKQ